MSRGRARPANAVDGQHPAPSDGKGGPSQTTEPSLEGEVERAHHGKNWE